MFQKAKCLLYYSDVKMNVNKDALQKWLLGYEKVVSVSLFNVSWGL